MIPTKKLAAAVLERSDAVEAYQEKLARIVVDHHESLGKLLNALPKLQADALALLVPDLTSRLDSTIPRMVQDQADSIRGEMTEQQRETATWLAGEAQRTRDALTSMIDAGMAAVTAERQRVVTAKEITDRIETIIESKAGEVAKSELGSPAVKALMQEVIDAQPPVALPSPEIISAPGADFADLFKGTYAKGSKAKRGEIYAWAGGTYLCTKDTRAEPWRNGKSWAMLAAPGRDGMNGSGGGGSSLPDQTGNNGKFLTTNGTAASWATIAGGGDLLAANNLSELTATASTARTNLGLGTAAVAAIGDFDAAGAAAAAQAASQPVDSDLTAIAALAPSNDDIIQRKAGAWTNRTVAQLKSDLAVTATDVGLGNVTNDVQTKAAVVPNTAPTAGQILVGNAGNTAYAPVSASGDVTVASTGAVTIANDAVTYAKMQNVSATSRVLGRIAGGAGDVEELTGANIKTIAAITPADFGAGILAADMTLGEATGQIVLDPALSADGKWSGICEAGTAGAALAFGDLCYFAVADSRWELTDADAAATAGPVKLGICVLAAAGDGSATVMLLWGKVRADAVFPAMTVGAPLYVGLTAGDIVLTETWGTDDVIRIIGHANTADELFFHPSNDYITYV